MARYQVGNEIFEIDDAVPEAEAIEAINQMLAQPRDSALDFSYDSARQMTGAGLETIGDLSEKYFGGDLGISEYGEGLRQRAADDITKGRYQREFEGSFSDQKSVGDAAGWVLQGIQENAVSGGAALAGGAAATATALISLPAAAVIGGITTIGSAILGTGETALEMREKTGEVNEELALGTGAIIGLLDRFGAGKVFSKSQIADMTVGQVYDELQKKGYRRAAEEFGKEVGKRAGAEGITEATQEGAIVGATAATGGEYTAGEVGDRLLDAGVIGTGQAGAISAPTQAGKMAISGTQVSQQMSKMDKQAELLREIGIETDNPDVIDAANQLNIAVEAARSGDLTLLKEIADAEQNADVVPVDESNRESRAQASFAVRLQDIAEDGDALSGKPLDLQDVNPGSEGGARKAVETAHGQIAGQIAELVKILGDKLDPKQADTLAELFERSDVKQALKFSRNKVKKSFPTSAFDKLGELTAGTREGDILRNLVLESMELTRVHNNGYVGGLSGFVDKFANPFATAGSYDGKSQMANAVRLAGTAVAGTATGGVTLLAQLGLVGGSRAFDALSGGRRSAVGSYVKDNVGNTRLGVNPTLPSLFEQEKSLQKSRQERAMLLEALRANIQLDPAAGPEFAILKTANEAIQTYEGTSVPLTAQDINDANEALLASLGEEYQPFYDALRDRQIGDPIQNEHMALITDMIVTMKRSAARRDQQTQDMTVAAEARTLNQAAREAGKLENQAFVQQIRDQLNNDKKASAVVKGRIMTVLDEFGRNLGSDPVKSIDQEIKKITSGETPVPQDMVDKYLTPYRNRVKRQQQQAAAADKLAADIEGKGQKNEVFDPDVGMLVDNTPFDPIDLGEETAATILPIYPTADAVPPVKVKTKVDGIRWLFENLYVKHYGTTDPIEYSPANVVVVGRKMAAEALKALEQDNNAIGWYDRTLKDAKAVMTLLDPTLGPRSNNPDNELAFDFALAVTSNGTAVLQNFEYAYNAYQTWQKTGFMPTNWKQGGERNNAMRNAFAFYNTYTDLFNRGEITLSINDFFNREMTRGELTAFVDEFNATHNTSVTVPTKDAVDTMVNGSYILGPKIGQGFYQNLRGNYDNLTADMWWMRMWNRQIGRPFEPEKSEKDMAKNRDIIVREMKSSKGNDRKLVNEALKNIGETRDGLYNSAERIDTLTNELQRVWNRYYARHKKETGRNPDKPQLWKTVGTHFKNMGDSVRDMPGDNADRKFMREATGEAIRLMKTTGVDISVADFQALMWYPEKRLLKMLGVKPGQGDDNDYLDAAVALAKKEGFTNDQIEEALGASVRGRTSNANRTGPDGQDGGFLNSVDQTDPGQGQGEFEFSQPILASATDQSGRPAPNVTIPTPHEVKEEADLASALFEVGKRGSPYEFGVDNAEDIQRLIEAFGIHLDLYKSQSKMFQEQNTSGQNTMGVYNPYMAQGRGRIGAMEPGFPRRKENRFGEKEYQQTETGFLTTLLHELSHHIESKETEVSYNDFIGDNETRTPQSGRSARSGLYYQREFTPTSFRELIKNVVNLALYDKYTDDVISRDGTSLPTVTVDKARAKKISAELDDLQTNTEFFFRNRPELSPEFVRPDGDIERSMARTMQRYDDAAAKTSEGGEGFDFVPRKTYEYDSRQSRERFIREYVRDPAETAVDPLWVYLGNPQLAKEVMPETTKLIREFLNDSDLTKGIVTFYSTPLATALAAALALLAVNGPGGEEEEMMPMSGSPATGMLTI